MQMNISFPGGSRVQAEFANHRVMTDQRGSAPTPFDYFLASIGTCAGYYVLSFLDQRGIATEDVSVELRADRDPESRMFRSITLKIRLPEDFPPKYRRAVIQAANLCSVKRHLEHPPEIVTEATPARGVYA